MRHDVLLEVAESDMVEASRTRYIRDVYTEQYDQFSMHKPHVTFGIFESEEEAKEWVDRLNKNMLPYSVLITGVTID